MQKTTFLLLLIVALLSANIGQNTLRAQEPLPSEHLFSNGTAYLSGDNNNALTNLDLETFVDLAFREQITVSQAQNFYERLSDEQKEVISDLVAVKAGISLEDWRRERELHTDRIHRTSSLSSVYSSDAADPTIASGEIWRQPIENK